ncbi:hypothetical protein [Siphonobacter sp. SORGH_AS_0500]|uniref:hypothetical protein n=1 Tax=Siphonobacter sp. SORGH_AS_0500 TaxID=1864824 RepID=UPI000CA88B3D|nr:hypothetical protein [Siphonobacter sp. SORGH_AS_0500]MDR6194870.1 hypothetical protein [Siphonobacter sp. SORGH_AS_0500]PKK38540.1 hypothetical protein BWI96_01860 [Siphonobacter sp. SORGH_AS_0500]
MHFFTACWTKHLPNIAILADQVAQHHPGSFLYVGWIDQPIDVTLPENVSVVSYDQLSILKNLAHKYTQTELLHIARVFLAKWLLKEDTLVFLEPETQIFRPLTELSTALTKQPAVLFSQWLRPHPDRQFPDSKHYLNYGTYFSGIWGIRPGTITNQFLEWWCHNLETRGGYNLCEGQGSDQLWLDMAPALFEGVFPLRNSAYGIHVGNAFERSGENPASFHFHSMKADGSYPSYVSNRSIPSYFQQASRKYSTNLTAHRLYSQASQIKPAYGLADPAEPVSLIRQHWAESFRKLIKKINTYQPDFLFKDSQPK